MESDNLMTIPSDIKLAMGDYSYDDYNSDYDSVEICSVDSMTDDYSTDMSDDEFDSGYGM